MQKKYYYIIWVILFICYYPLLIPGYIFSLDQAFPYVYSWPNFGANNYWLHIIWLGFSQLGIPTWILEKLVYILMFSLISIYWYKLLKKTKSDIAITFGILFLFLNPFFYGRFVEGQVNIYLSYALFTPLFYYITAFFQEKKYSLWKIIAPLSLILCLTSIHNVFFIGLTLSVFSIVYLIYADNKKLLIQSLGVLTASLILLNSFWLIPTMQREDLTSQITSFWQAHQNAFQSPSGTYNLYTNIASLRGYWWEGEQRFIKAELQNTHYIFLLIFLYILTVTGALSLWKNPKKHSLGITLISLWILCYILSLGISKDNVFSWINSFFLNYIPFYSGFREPQKWLLVYTPVFTLLTAYGITYILKYLNTDKKKIFIPGVSLIIILFPILYTPATLVGHWGQLRPKLHPAEWTQIQDITYSVLPSETCSYEKCYSTLVLPWHGYIGIRWTQTPITLSGIAKYFSPHALIGDTLEIRNIYTQSNRAESKIIEKYLSPRGLLRNPDISVYPDFIQDIQSLGIDYIVLLKEADYSWYQQVLTTMEKESYITLEKENDMTILYKLKL